MDLSAIERRLSEFDQTHLLRWAEELSPGQLAALASQLERTDFARWRAEFEKAKTPAAKIDPADVAPIEVFELPQTDAARAEAAADARKGQAALQDGRCGVLLVAGGQGSRLGFEHPKGMFPIGPVRGSSLFQIFAEKILARGRAAGVRIPWYVMTSPGNRAETTEYFEKERYFGLKPEDVFFFNQGESPSVDAATGRMLLAEKGKLAVNPNGHGGTLLALQEEGALADMARRGVDLLYYFQVDNPFVEVLEPAFLGRHLRTESEFSAKVVRKMLPDEKVGLVVLHRGKPMVIEYSDLPKELGEARAAAHGAAAAGGAATAGGLKYWPGSIAIHVFSRGFLERTATALPCHVAKKAVPFIDGAGALQKPASANAIKFEMFIFDALPLARRACIVETDREEEFQPLKNATGDDSPATVQAALMKRAAKWIRSAGIPLETDAQGAPRVKVEISPLAGLDESDFAGRGWPTEPILVPAYFGGEA